MDYVYANFTGLVLHAPCGSVDMTMGDAWFADDPFVEARPDLFSMTPVVVRSTVGRLAPDATPLGAKRKARARA